jgi:signal transduction histidine kinase
VASGGRVELHVSDEGEGFPDDFLPVAFERFSRADGDRSPDGAGLGLALVRAVAVAHGGTAEAARTPRGGADVWLAVPRAASVQTERVAVEAGR